MIDILKFIASLLWEQKAENPYRSGDTAKKIPIHPSHCGRGIDLRAGSITYYDPIKGAPEEWTNE